MKRKIILILFILIGLAILSTFIILAFYHPERAANLDYTNPSPMHAVRVDYLDIGKSQEEVTALETQLKQAGVNMVAVGAGRSDWTYFPWSNHQSCWSDDVKSSGTDYLLADSTRFGKWAHVNAVVDVLAPRYIEAHPDAAAISWFGVPSENMVGTMELVDGSFGQNLLEMIENIATYYPVNSITITELVYYTDGFGEQDKTAYLAYSKQSDWPRMADGQINIDDDAIGAWRSYEIARFLEKAATITHQHGKQLFFETHISVDEAGQVSVNTGTDLNLFLNYADRLIVRGSSEPSGRSPKAISTIAKYLANFEEGRIIMSIGLWDRDYGAGVQNDQMSAIAYTNFQFALQAATQSGMTNLWVTPSFLMSDLHWQVLQDFWSQSEE